MERFFQFITLSVFILHTNADDFDYCYAADKNHYELFSTWTPSKNGWGHVEDPSCKAIYMWSLMKHGVKSFSDEQIKRNENLFQIKMDIKLNDEEKRSALCWDDFQNMHSSRNSFSIDKYQNENLIKSAYSKHELYAFYLKRFFGFIQTSNKDNFEFQFSKVEGAEGSAIQFSNEFLGTKFNNIQGNGIIKNDDLLQPRNTCAKWNVVNNQGEKFIQSPVFQFMRSRISFRLGFTYAISIENITAMYESCVFWHNLPSISNPPFCAAFLPEDLKIIEYLLDLKHYYEFGYGNPLSEKMGCALVRDMLDKLNKASTGKLDGKKGTFYVADEENIMGMVTNMGLYRDEEPIKYDNYYIQREKRKWRSSLLSPFTATIHAILFNCGNNNEKRVKFYLNHDQIKFDACKDTSDKGCPLDIFFAEIKKNLKEDTCDKKFCGEFPKPSGSNIINYSVTVMIACLLFSQL